MTINGFVKYFAEELAGLEWYDAREVKAMALRLLEEVAGFPSYKVLVEPEMELGVEAEARLRMLAAELATGRPLQYVLGYEMFCGHKFNVSEGVLIPRPETEELVRLVVNELGGSMRVLDVCTGSGCIAWSIAAELSGKRGNENSSMVYGCDISDAALGIASGQDIYDGACVNEANIVPRFFKCDILDKAALDVILENIGSPHTYNDIGEIDESLKLDVIVSNPPYVCEEEKAQMRANVLDFEPDCALFVPDENPLLFYSRIAELGRLLLRSGGMLFFEVNERFALQTAQMLEENGFVGSRVIEDLFGKPRFVVARN